jgi:hypothetical protein
MTNSVNDVHLLTINAGISDLHMKDKYLAPAVFSSAVFSGCISYKYITGSTSHQLTADYSRGKADSKNTAGETTHNIGALSYTYMWQFLTMPAGNDKIIYSIGGGASTTAENTDLIINSYDGSAFTDQSWYWAHSINISASAEYIISGETSLSLQFTIPVYSIISRPRNGHWLNENNHRVIYDSFLHAAEKGTGSFTGENFSINSRLEYRHYLGEGIAFSGCYSFSFMSSKEPNDLKLGLYKNDFLAGIIISL